MDTHFEKLKMLALRTLAGDELEDDVNNAMSFLEEFDDVLYVCGLLRPKSKLYRALGLQKLHLNIL